MEGNGGKKRCPYEGRDELLGFLGDRRKIQEHPCYDPKAAHRFGRMHLPVAPKCMTVLQLILSKI